MQRRNLIIAIIIAALVVTGVVVFLYQQQPVSSPSTNPPSQTTESQGSGKTGDQEQPTTYPIKVYFSKHPESDDDPTKVYSFDRTAPDKGVGTYAIQQLLAGPAESERTNGYFSDVRVRNDASNCGTADFKLKIEQGVATLEFCRTFDAVGTLADARAQETIKATLLQFPSVKKVIILGKDGHCQFDMSGEDRCMR